MPTFDIRVSGGAYTTAVAAEAGTNTGTLSGGETRGQYQGTWGSGDVDAGGQLTIAGATVTSTNYWALDADSPNTIQSSWQTGRAKMVGSSSSELIRCAQSYTRIRGIQAENTGTGTRVVQHFNSVLILCESCFMRGRGGWSGRAAGETGYCINSIASNGGTQTLRIGHESNNASGTSHVYYCISVNGGTNASFLNTAGTLNTTGCVAYGHSVDSWSGTVGGDYNASDRNDAPGANSLQTIADPFVNYAGGDFAIDATDAAAFIGAGGAPPGGTYPVTLDAFGTTRLNPTTIGWQELGSAGGDDTTADIAGVLIALEGSVSAALAIDATIAGSTLALVGDASAGVSIEALASGVLSGLTGDIAADLAIETSLAGSTLALAGDVSAELALSGAIDGNLLGLTGAMAAELALGASVAGQLPGLVGAVSVGVSIEAAVAATLPLLSGAFAGVAAATVDGVLPGLVGQVAAELAISGAVAGSLPGLTGDAVARVGVGATLAAALPGLTGDASAGLRVPATVQATLPALQGAFDADVNGDTEATMGGVLPMLAAAAVAALAIQVSVDAGIPLLVGAFAEAVEVPVDPPVAMGDWLDTVTDYPVAAGEWTDTQSPPVALPWS